MTRTPRPSARTERFATWRSLAACALAAILVPVSAAPRVAESSYRDELLRWRAERDASLKGDNGWLSVAGLFFLEPGANAFGTDPSNAIVLPAGTTPGRAGTFRLVEGRVFFELGDSAEATLAGRPVREGELRPASVEPSRPADVLRLGRLSLQVHRSGPRIAIRLRDPQCPVRTTFTGTRWFDVAPEWRVTATYKPFPVPEKVRILNVLGDQSELDSPGMVEFTHGGQVYRLRALEDGDELWFVFTDATAGTETYEASRFLYAPRPTAGRLVLDFNRAYNPPCAYNPYTTCPLPPRENRLPIPVRAGEKLYPDKWHPPGTPR